jgi:hypothetical protein
MNFSAMHDVPPLYLKGVRYLGFVSIALLSEYVTGASSTNSGFGWRSLGCASSEKGSEKHPGFT